MSTAVWVCKVCRFPVNQIRQGGAVYFEHAADAGSLDHDPDPILTDSLDQVSMCDFCGIRGPMWVFEAESFEMLPEEKLSDHVQSVEDWLACTACKQDLMEYNTEGLVKRWARNHPSYVTSRRRRDQFANIQRRLLTEFWAHATGVVKPLLHH